MAIGKKPEKGKANPKSEACEPRGAQRNFCTHCKISGNWVAKCWKLLPHIHPSKGNKVVHVPEEEETMEKVAQDTSIPDAALEKEEEQIEGSLT